MEKYAKLHRYITEKLKKDQTKIKITDVKKPIKTRLPYIVQSLPSRRNETREC